MKNIFAIVCILLLLGSPLAVSADTDDAEPLEMEQLEPEDKDEAIQQEEVNELSLEDVIKRGTENSKNLTALQLRLAMQENDFLQANYDKNKAVRDIKNLEDKIDDLKEERDGLEGEARTENFEDRAELLDSIKELEKEIESLERSVQQMENGQLQLQFQEEEAREGVRVMLTSRYTDLLLLQRDISYTRSTLESAKKDYNKQQILFNLGRISQEAFRQAEEALVNAEKQLADKEKKYRQSLSDLSFDIGISYNKDIVLKPIDIVLEELERPEDFTSLIEESYKMKRAKMDYESAVLERDQVYEDFEQGDATKYEKENQDLLFQMAELNLESTNRDLQNSIEQIYRNVENSYENYREAVRQLEITQKEMELLEVRYNLGRVSKFDYEQALLTLDAANLKVFEAQIQHFNLQLSVEALQKGYI